MSSSGHLSLVSIRLSNANKLLRSASQAMISIAHRRRRANVYIGTAEVGGGQQIWQRKTPPSKQPNRL